MAPGDAPAGASGAAARAAAQQGDTGALAALAASGAALDTADSFGNTPLYYACHYGHAAAVALLVESGCRDDATRRCWRNALDRSALPLELRRRIADAPSKADRRELPAEMRDRRRKVNAAALAAQVGVDEVVALAMLYGATRLRRGGNTHKMTCSPRKWSGPDEIDDFFAPLLPDGTTAAVQLSSTEEVTVRSLDMRKCLMAGHGAACLSRVLEQPACPLLDLYLFANALRDEGTAALAHGLASNSSLTKLNLCGNQIGPGGAAALGVALGQHPALTQCDLNCNELTDAAIGPLTARLGCGTASVLAVLSLRKNGLTDEAVAVIRQVCVKNERLADVAVCSDWPPPRRQKKLLASSGLQDHVSAEAAAELRELLRPRSEKLKGARACVDDPAALRRLFCWTEEDDRNGEEGADTTRASPLGNEADRQWRLARLRAWRVLHSSNISGCGGGRPAGGAAV